MADEHGKKVVMDCKMKFRTASSCNFQLQKHQLYRPNQNAGFKNPYWMALSLLDVASTKT